MCVITATILQQLWLLILIIAHELQKRLIDEKDVEAHVLPLPLVVLILWLWPKIVVLVL